MPANPDPSTTGLVAINLLLGALCLACLVAIVAAVVADLRERHAIRASLPKGWPPDEPPAKVVRRLPKRRRRARKEAIQWPHS
jgi:hypothetical protein